MDNQFLHAVRRQGGDMHFLVVLLSAASVLHGWDDRREQAWAASDPAALRSLYVSDSVAADRDVRLLRDYTARGLVVRRIVTQVFALQVLRADDRHLRLRLVDRVAGGEVSAGARVSTLGTTRPSTRVVSLRRVGGSWRVVSVTERAPRR